ncbi:hypothetical protein Syun_005313 [Stephania yunnanensis]|uniref:Uncharacterized protein n=1 Tax=Stephania yunnanensis TaxID=152371 RepID=A0AAP0Q5T6_9MAGN
MGIPFPSAGISMDNLGQVLQKMADRFLNFRTAGLPQYGQLGHGTDNECRLGHREQKDEWAPRLVEVFQRHNVLPPEAIVSAGSVNSACTAVDGTYAAWIQATCIISVAQMTLALVGVTHKMESLDTAPADKTLPVVWVSQWWSLTEQTSVTDLNRWPSSFISYAGSGVPEMEDLPSNKVGKRNAVKESASRKKRKKSKDSSDSEDEEGDDNSDGSEDDANGWVEEEARSGKASGSGRGKGAKKTPAQSKSSGRGRGRPPSADKSSGTKSRDDLEDQPPNQSIVQAMD